MKGALTCRHRRFTPLSRDQPCDGSGRSRRRGRGKLGQFLIRSAFSSPANLAQNGVYRALRKDLSDQKPQTDIQTFCWTREHSPRQKLAAARSNIREFIGTRLRDMFNPPADKSRSLALQSLQGAARHLGDCPIPPQRIGAQPLGADEDPAKRAQDHELHGRQPRLRSEECRLRHRALAVHGRPSLSIRRTPTATATPAMNTVQTSLKKNAGRSSNI